MTISAETHRELVVSAGARTDTRSRRRIALAGITFVVAFLVSFFGGASSDIHETPAQTLANFSSDTTRLRGGIAWIAAVVAVIALVWFLAGLVNLCRTAGASETQTLAVAIAGSLLTATVAVASAVRATPIGDLLLDNEKRAGTTGKLTPAFAHLAQTTGSLDDWLVFFGVGAAAAVLVLAVTLAARSTHMLPRWLCWAGFVVVPLLASLAFFSVLLMAAWFVAASIGIARFRTPRDGAVAN